MLQSEVASLRGRTTSGLGGVAGRQRQLRKFAEIFYREKKELLRVERPPAAWAAWAPAPLLGPAPGRRRDQGLQPRPTPPSKDKDAWGSGT